jgi:hypothetical protein
MSTIKELNKKINCILDNNYQEHLNLKKSIDELKILISNKNLITNNKISIENENVKNDEKILEILDYKINENNNKLLKIIDNKNNTIETEIKEYKVPDYLLEENITSKINNTIQIVLRNNNTNNKNFIFEEKQKIKKEIDEIINLIQINNKNSIEKMQNEHLEKNMQNINLINNQNEEKIYTLRNNIHRNLGTIDTVIKNMKNEMNVKFHNIQKNEESLKLEIKSLQTNLCNNNNEKKIEEKTEENTQKKIEENISELQNEILMKKIIEQEINNASNIILKKVDLLISSKFIEISKNLSEFVTHNASDLIFKNKKVVNGLEIWIQTQIKLILETNKS